MGAGIKLTVQGEQHPSCLHVTVQFKHYASAFLQHECNTPYFTTGNPFLNHAMLRRYAFHVSQSMTAGGNHVLPALQPAAHAAGALSSVEFRTADL